MIAVTGAYQTRFGELWDKGLDDLILESGQGALADAHIKPSQIDLVIVGNKLSGKLDGQDHLGALAADVLGIKAPGFRVEAACASGGVAMHQAVTALKSGLAKKVLVIGAEKMTDKANGEVAAALMGAGSSLERRVGLSFVGLYALMAQVYLDKFPAKRRHLAQVAVKNHQHASLNPKAHFGFPLKIETVLNSAMVAEPLTLFDCSPISDGAAAVVVEQVKDKNNHLRAIPVLASTLATDTIDLTKRDSLVELKATIEAGQKAYSQAGIKPADVDLAEVHDCFTIAEILALEDLGFCKKGEGYKGITKAINLSGGLKACGHPVGCTGVKQIVELTTHLRGEGAQRQLKRANLGLAHNIGGTGATAVVHILGRKETDL